MAGPSSRREVQLVHAQAPGRPLIRAELYRDFPPVLLENLESQWQEGRERAATEGMAEGLAPLEHSHWDWRNKIDSVEAGRHLLVAIECQGIVQGIMAILRTPRHSQFTGELVVYVDYLEAAPWNLKGSSISPRFVGIGTVLMADAIRLSQETGLNGRVGLHSLPQAEGFYETRCRMTRFSQDVSYYNLTYFEFVGHQATAWLASFEEPP
jgi:hypothetical protein